MKKVIIIGNSGSGKTWLGRRLASLNNMSCFELDNIFWEPGGFSIKRKASDVEADLKKIQILSEWVAEGVFGHIVDNLISYADTLIYLDMPWEECEANLMSRGSESSMQSEPVKAEENFWKLLKWSSEYSTRDGKSSKKYHSIVFKNFSGRKVLLQDRDAINRFLNIIESDLIIS